MPAHTANDAASGIAPPPGSPAGAAAPVRVPDRMPDRAAAPAAAGRARLGGLATMTLSLGEALRPVLACPVLLRERWQSGVAYNPLSARMAQDPYRAYAAMRERDPVHRSRLIDAYFRTIVAERRKAPRDDILSALVQAEDEGERLTEREMLNLLRLLLIAGNETTTNLIGNGVLTLLRNPGELERLRQDPGLIPSAVEELLRFDSPAQATFRRALADCEVNGSPIRRRDNIVLLLGAANRDPDAFEAPDRLDVARSGRAHLSLGRGIHHCLGAPLARLEGRIALEMLLERFPRIGLRAGRPRFRPSVVIRGLRSLPLRCARSR